MKTFRTVNIQHIHTLTHTHTHTHKSELDLSTYKSDGSLQEAYYFDLVADTINIPGINL